MVLVEGVVGKKTVEKVDTKNNGWQKSGERNGEGRGTYTSAPETNEVNRLH